jgi:uncharacterized membrane protein (DUF106 family)
MTTIAGILKFAFRAYLAYLLVVLLVALWMYYPTLAVAVTSLIVGLTLRIAYLWWDRRRNVRQAMANRAAVKAEYYRRERLHRAQQYPDIVFEENATEWSKELSRE